MASAPSTVHRTASAAWRRAACASLVLALLWLQQLGLMHRYAHVAGPVVASAASLAAAGAAQASDVGALPAHDKPVCLVLDQLCMADAVPLASLALPAAVPVAALVLWVRPFAVFPALVAFLARGPPLFSL